MALVLAATARQSWNAMGRRALPLSFSSCRRSESTSSASESPSPHFMWRHSAQPIERIVKGDNLSGLPVDKQKDTFFQEVMLGSMLHRDWYELLLPRVWKDSLANDCAWAFQKGLASLLSRVFSVPVNDIDKEDLGLIFDSKQLSTKKNTSSAADGAEEEGSNESRNDASSDDEEESKASTTDTTITDDKKEEAEAKREVDALCFQMLEKKLIELYANVDPNTTDLTLCMRPISSKLESVFSVIFTREAAQEDASLVEAGRKMRHESRVSRNPLEVSRMLKELDAQKKPIMFFTIIADVSIQCLESFQVTNKSTGTVLSGSSEPQEVTHLLRFEITTDLDGGRRLGSWRIVDWDDLLEGNVWY